MAVAHMAGEGTVVVVVIDLFFFLIGKLINVSFTISSLSLLICCFFISSAYIVVGLLL